MSQILFPKKLPDLPKWDWKKNLRFWVVNSEKVVKEVHKMKVKPWKPIPKISEKKKKRMKEEWTEVQVFREVWETTPHICQHCKKPVNNAFIWERLIKPQCFPHKLPKSMFPKCRLIPQNIWLVCSIECHREFDKDWKDLEKRRLFEQELLLLWNEMP